MSHYIGEMSRTLWERNEEHQSDALNPSQLSHMRDHMAINPPEELKDVITSFTMSKLKSCKSALSRQVREAVEID